jgi:predicted KAP-like P-loop ATPase
MDQQENGRWLIVSPLGDLDSVTMPLKESETDFEYLGSLELAGAELGREGYRYDVLLLDVARLDDWEKWFLEVASSYYWLYIVLFHEMASDPLSKISSAVQSKDTSTTAVPDFNSRVFLWDDSRTDEFATLAEVGERRAGFVSSLPQPRPLQAGDTRYLADTNGLLFSLSQSERPWLLEADAIVIPVSNKGLAANLAIAMADKVATSPPQAFLKQLVEPLDGRMIPAEPKAVGPFSFSWKKGGSTHLDIIAATGRDSTGRHRIDAAVTASLASIRLAEQHHFRTLILPVIGSGAGGLDPVEICQHILAETRRLERLEYLKHVIITVREESQAQACSERIQTSSQTPIRPQEFLNDEPGGRDDQLEVEQEVEALADAIALKKLQPPLVVGILGGWGTGKSFVLDLIHRRLKWIRALPVPDGEEEFPYVGHPYVISFNAWTYAKASLWASLMQTILEGLNRQLGLEDQLRTAGADLKRGTDIWKLFDELTDDELESFKKGLGEEAVKKVVEALKSSAVPATAETLWSALSELHEQERKLLEKDESDLGVARTALEDGQADREQQIAKELDTLRQQRAETIDKLHKDYATRNRTERDRYTKKIGEINSTTLSTIETARLNYTDAGQLNDEDRDIELERARIDGAVAEQEAEVGNQIRKTCERAAWRPFLNSVVGALDSSIDEILKHADKDENGNPRMSFAEMRGQIGTWKRFMAGASTWTWGFFALAAFGLTLPYLVDALQATWAKVGTMLASLVALTTPVTKAFQNTYTMLAEKKQVYDAEVARFQPNEPRETLIQQALDRKDENGASLAEKLTTLKKRTAEREVEREKQLIVAKQAIEAAEASQRVELIGAESEHRQKLDEQEQELRRSIESEKDKRLETGEIDRLRRSLVVFKKERLEKIAELEAKIEDRKQRIGITGHSANLLEFVRDRLGSDTYASNLGLVHQVHTDLLEITNALQRASRSGLGTNQVNPFPRGEPRIVLMVDDLDRCPPSQVVEMLEAAQLLVKTNLFVVVIAMDVRYVTRTLEKHYKGVLVEDGDPSGLDYIEKIVQIPYRVPDIDPGVMERFLGSQFTLEAEPEHVQQLDKNLPATEGSVETGPAEVVFQVSPSENLIPEQVQVITISELQLLTRCCNAAGVSPRSGTRLANVFKLLKIIWYHRGQPKGPSPEIKQAILLLLAIAATYQEVMRLLLWRMEIELDKVSPYNSSLRQFLRNTLDQLQVPDSLVQEILEVKSAINDLGTEPTLRDFGRKNLRLVHSFCFAGEMTAKVPSRDEETGTMELKEDQEAGAKDSAEDEKPPETVSKPDNSAGRKRKKQPNKGG